MNKYEQAYADTVRAWVEEQYSAGAGLLATSDGYGYYTDREHMSQTFQILGVSWQDAAEKLGLHLSGEPSSFKRLVRVVSEAT